MPNVKKLTLLLVFLGNEKEIKFFLKINFF